MVEAEHNGDTRLADELLAQSPSWTWSTGSGTPPRAPRCTPGSTGHSPRRPASCGTTPLDRPGRGGCRVRIPARRPRPRSGRRRQHLRSARKEAHEIYERVPPSSGTLFGFVDGMDASWGCSAWNPSHSRSSSLPPARRRPLASRPPRAQKSPPTTAEFEQHGRAAPDPLNPTPGRRSSVTTDTKTRREDLSMPLIHRGRDGFPAPLTERDRSHEKSDRYRRGACCGAYGLARVPRTLPPADRPHPPERTVRAPSLRWRLPRTG
jgi:hypothetical protein